MITLEEAVEIVKIYLNERGREYLSVREDRMGFEPQKEVSYGRHEGKKKDTFAVTYYVEGYQDPTLFFVELDAYTGEVFCTLGPHGAVEEREDWLKETKE